MPPNVMNGGGAMPQRQPGPPQGGAPMQRPPGAPGGAPGGSPAGAPPHGIRVPPQFQRFIDPNNKLQGLLLQRINRTPPQFLQVLATFTPAQLALLKAWMPEVAFMFDALIARKNGAGRGAPGAQGAGQQQPQPPMQGAGAPPASGGGAPPPGGPGGPPGGAVQRPQTGLADI